MRTYPEGLHPPFAVTHSYAFAMTPPSLICVDPKANLCKSLTVKLVNMQYV